MSYLPQPDIPGPPSPEDAAPARTPPDPYEALDDLMAVIEGLCPVWSEKEILRMTTGFRL